MSIQDNNIYNLDCLEGIKGVKSNSVKLIVAAPPYFLGMTHNGQKGSFVDLAICRPFYEELFREFKRVLTDDGEVFWFCDWRGYAFYFPIFDAVLGAKNLIVWDKISGAGSHYTFCHEFMIWHHVQPNICRGGQNVWRSKAFSSGAKATNGNKVHPTQKTLEIIEKIVFEGSEEGDLVLDPFTGSGTTAIAARRNNRRFIGFELDIENFDIIKARYSKGVQQVFQLI